MEKFENFFKETKDKFFSYLLKLSNNYDDACDILQESYSRMLEYYPNNLNPAILYKIGYNLFIDLKRKASKFVDSETIKETFSSKENTLSNVLTEERYTKAMKLIKELPYQERNILLLATTHEMNYKQIGEIMGLSEANVKVKIHRIRKKLKEKMKKEGLI